MGRQKLASREQLIDDESRRKEFRSVRCMHPTWSDVLDNRIEIVSNLMPTAYKLQTGDIINFRDIALGFKNDSGLKALKEAHHHIYEHVRRR